jgi:hypothetical protein
MDGTSGAGDQGSVHGPDRHPAENEDTETYEQETVGEWREGRRVLNAKDKLEELRNQLASTMPGKVPDREMDDIVRILKRHWDDLTGSDDGGMEAGKLTDRRGKVRAEEVQWNPPILNFRIERHGARVLGSTRGELQTWEINLTQGTATITALGYRQLEPMDARLDVKRLADETAAMVVSGCESPRLKWVNPNRVRVLTADVIPTTNKQTTTSRRKRFVAALEPILDSQGWQRVQVNNLLVFEIRTPTDVGEG